MISVISLVVFSSKFVYLIGIYIYYNHLMMIKPIEICSGVENRKVLTR
jgi:hypothetical protein